MLALPSRTLESHAAWNSPNGDVRQRTKGSGRLYVDRNFAGRLPERYARQLYVTVIFAGAAFRVMQVRPRVRKLALHSLHRTAGRRRSTKLASALLCVLASITRILPTAPVRRIAPPTSRAARCRTATCSAENGQPPGVVAKIQRRAAAALPAPPDVERGADCREKPETGQDRLTPAHQPGTSTEFAKFIASGDAICRNLPKLPPATVVLYA